MKSSSSKGGNIWYLQVSILLKQPEYYIISQGRYVKIKIYVIKCSFTSSIFWEPKQGRKQDTTNLMKLPEKDKKQYCYKVPGCRTLDFSEYTNYYFPSIRIIIFRNYSPLHSQEKKENQEKFLVSLDKGRKRTDAIPISQR